jgi:hypothetical protein
MTFIEARVLAMTKAEREDYLRRHGWYRLSGGKTQTWYAPGWKRVNPRLVEPPEHDRAHYSLARAIRTALSEES